MQNTADPDPGILGVTKGKEGCMYGIQKYIFLGQLSKIIKKHQNLRKQNSLFKY